MMALQFKKAPFLKANTANSDIREWL